MFSGSRTPQGNLGQIAAAGSSLGQAQFDPHGLMFWKAACGLLSRVKALLAIFDCTQRLTEIQEHFRKARRRLAVDGVLEGSDRACGIAQHRQTIAEIVPAFPILRRGVERGAIGLGRQQCRSVLLVEIARQPGKARVAAMVHRQGSGLGLVAGRGQHGGKIEPGSPILRGDRNMAAQIGQGFFLAVKLEQRQRGNAEQRRMIRRIVQPLA